MISIGSFFPASAIVTTLAAMATTTTAEARNAHFTMEFIPTYKNGLPYKCNANEIKTIELFLGDILAKETGMVKHSVEYLDRMYDSDTNSNDNSNGKSAASRALKNHHFSKVRGFDFTFDCPVQDDHYACPDNDWCHVLCLDETVKPGHESLTEQASHLKEKLHSQAKTLEGGNADANANANGNTNGNTNTNTNGPNDYNVKCLGHTAELDFHLLVSVSP